MLLVFLAVAVIISTAAATITVVNSTSSSHIELGQVAYNVAEAGIENAILRLLRDPNYLGETLTVGNGTCTINVSGTNPYTITARGAAGNFVKQIVATAQFTNGVMSITSWSESY
jgi:hypothetical protein